ncbi:MAG TPA: serine protease [Chitinophagales bacterium]|nr:serine protease [Chitinophagales bacterium]HNK07834.1 serine protease [Saprospiraceae bacterium]
MKQKQFIFTTLLLLVLQASLFGQITTRNPYVENHTQTEIADLPIVGVSIDNGMTMVMFDYITSRNLAGGWLSLSSTTTLTAKNSSISLRIKDWGVYNGEAESLNFNEKYSVKADRKYTFFMVFAELPAGIENITIRENAGTNEFYWKGIHINNPANGSSTREQTSTYRETSGNDKFEITGSGSGFVITANGLIVTSYHVVSDANKIQIRGVNGEFDKAFKAKILAFDKNNDLAILKIDDTKFTQINSIPYSLSDKTADVGDDVFVLGYPLRAVMGDEIKLTNGLISSKSGFQGDVTSYQISATVQAGNSGCPLFDKNGNIIGVVNARLPVENASYAIKTPYLKTLLSSLENQPALTTSNSLVGKSLSEQVKSVKKFVYIIEVSE